jgi:hypothetical protein
MDIELHLLRNVAALASERIFAKAARVVHLSQPALPGASRSLCGGQGWVPIKENPARSRGCPSRLLAELDRLPPFECNAET